MPEGDCRSTGTRWDGRGAWAETTSVPVSRPSPYHGPYHGPGGTERRGEGVGAKRAPVPGRGRPLVLLLLLLLLLFLIVIFILILLGRRDAGGGLGGRARKTTYVPVLCGGAGRLDVGVATIAHVFYSPSRPRRLLPSLFRALPTLRTVVRSRTKIIAAR